jgi:Tol biopolymer transport system component
MKKVITLVLVLALGLAAESAKADFTFGTPVNLGSTVNSSAGDNAPYISADGLALYFHSTRPGGYGDKDLWVTTRPTTNDEWTEPVNLGPTINSSAHDAVPCISADGLALYFQSARPGGYGGSRDLWVTTRPTTENPWTEPVNLGPTVNSSDREGRPCISSDGLSLYFNSPRPGGFGYDDLYVTTRVTVEDEWGPPANLGPTVNSPNIENTARISADGRLLFFTSYDRPGGSGGADLWVATRSTVEDNWDTPVNLGPTVNNSAQEPGLGISTDGRTIYFYSNRPGGVGGHDIWQAPIIPIVDLNDDAIVDSADMCIIVDYWGTDEPLCDIGPMPWGDGIVDVQDLIVLAEHLFEEIPPIE